MVIFPIIILIANRRNGRDIVPNWFVINSWYWSASDGDGWSAGVVNAKVKNIWPDRLLSYCQRHRLNVIKVSYCLWLLRVAFIGKQVITKAGWQSHDVVHPGIVNSCRNGWNMMPKWQERLSGQSFLPDNVWFDWCLICRRPFAGVIADDPQPSWGNRKFLLHNRNSLTHRKFNWF